MDVDEMDSDVTELMETFAPIVDTSGLGELSKLCEQMAKDAAEIAVIEADLALKKKALHEVKAGKIPALMVELNLKDLTLTSGAKIILARKVSCKFIPAVHTDALNWLDAHGFSQMIRREVAVAFERGQEDTAARATQILTEAGFTPQIVKDVHHATLSAWARRMTDEKQPIPADLFNYDFFNYAEVK